MGVPTLAKYVKAADSPHEILRIDNSVVLRKSGLLFQSIPHFRKWELIGEQIFSVAESSTWWIADWLAYGETTFQERYREAIRKTSLNYQTLRNYAWGARRFDLSRRRDNLSFGHHAEVAALDPPEQDFWLRKAEEYGWSRNYLRTQVRASLRERTTSDSPDTGGLDATDDVAERRRLPPAESTGDLVGGSPDSLELRVSTDQLARFRAAAGTHNLDLEEWAVGVLDAAAFTRARATAARANAAHLTLADSFENEDETYFRPLTEVFS
jgi:hypothetical protein